MRLAERLGTLARRRMEQAELDPPWDQDDDAHAERVGDGYRKSRRKSRGRLWYARLLGGVTIWCCDLERMLDEFAARIVLDNRVPRMQTSARPHRP